MGNAKSIQAVQASCRKKDKPPDTAVSDGYIRMDVLLYFLLLGIPVITRSGSRQTRCVCRAASCRWPLRDPQSVHRCRSSG